MQGYKDIRIKEPKNIKLQGYNDARIHLWMDTRIQEYTKMNGYNIGAHI